MAGTDSTSLPYHEPDIVTILILTSFLLLSNLVNYILDRVLYCGLIGQILIGVAWGTPGAKWLDESLETAIVQLGYLGLILLVYEGGLSTSFQSLKANIILSVFVALTGICAPIGLSFALNGFASATPLQSFAAGAALCSTSLGTTFTILGTTGLLKTRLGVVLTSAAMLDDVVGLVMVQVISNLGASTADFSAVTVIRPVFVSIAFAVLCPCLCWLIVKPVTLQLNTFREKNRGSFISHLLNREGTVFFLHSAILISLVTAATYAGTSNLFAAYLAGASISWWDTELPHVIMPSQKTKNTTDENMQHEIQADSGVSHQLSCSGTAVYDKYYAPANERVFKPFFFTSIGFSIPITRMFTGPTVWRGVIYSILMTVGKLLCGAWLIRLSVSLPRTNVLHRLKALQVPHLWGRHGAALVTKNELNKEKGGLQGDKAAAEDATEPSGGTADSIDAIRPEPATSESVSATPQQSQSAPRLDTVSRNTSPSTKPFSLYPAAILGLAMVARGEIGFLISSLAESNGVLSTNGDDQVFLIVTWAIVLCTVLGPVGVGLLVRRVKRLEKEKETGGSARDVLGVWGVE